MCPAVYGSASGSVPRRDEVRSALPQPLAGRRVLVVEDEYFLADDIASALRQYGAEIMGPVPTPDAALALLGAGPSPDAAVLDVNLRGEMIYPVADALQARGVRFVFATGYDRSAIPGAYAAVPHWEKPHNPKDLVRTLSGLLSVA